MTDFSMQDSKSTSKQFFIQTFFYFSLALILFVSYWLVTVSKEIETMKNYSDRLKLIFAQIRLSFTCKYLALVFSVNTLMSILVKKLVASKKNGGFWLHTMHYSNIPVFLASTKDKKSIMCNLTISKWQIYKDHYRKKFYQVTELMTDFPMQDSKSPSKQFFHEQFFIFLL